MCALLTQAKTDLLTSFTYARFQYNLQRANAADAIFFGSCQKSALRAAYTCSFIRVVTQV